uniref:CRIB domain-containing protein RIC6 n=1 Tax=Cicer arietinum TaxID=3827 RepID=A0A3Q7XQY6_CICAR|nr:CRIB domain-containing protein RIC6 [Cicer arietinum]
MNQGGASAKMSSTAVKGQMKGLLKGLRYISQIFDEEDDKEIQIGFPTDVKHLAHIGCEDAKANAPSWMTEFTCEGEDSGNNSDTNSIKGDGKKSHNRRSRQRSSDSQSSTNSPPREEATSKTSRRHHSSESSRKQRQSTEEEDSNKPPTTKSSHRRKSKTTTSEDKDKDKDSSTKKGPRTRRSSKADSLTDVSFTDLGSGPGSSVQ